MIKLYKISEVAKIFKITRKTLIYYDKINLFKPFFVDEKTSYRYYDEEQFFKLRFILSLKEAGFSLNEILDYIETTSTVEILRYIKQKSEEVETKINNLKKTQEILKQKQLFFEQPLKKEEAKLIVLEKKRLHTLSFEKSSDFATHDRNYNLVVEASKELGFKEESTLFTSEVDISCFNEKKYATINCIIKFGFILPEPFMKLEIEDEILGGEYATIRHKGPWSSIDETYKTLIDFIIDNNYEIDGNAVEIFSKVNVHLGKGHGKIVDIFIPIKIWS